MAQLHCNLRIDLDEQGRARLDGLPPGPLTALVSTTERYFSIEVE